MDDKELDPKSSKGQLLSLLGKMALEADKIKAEIQVLDKNPELAEKIERVCRSCIACGGCIYNSGSVVD